MTFSPGTLPSGAKPNANQTAALLAAALGAHQAGRLQEAADGYQAILAHHPDHAEALHLFGMLHYQCGNLDQAESLLRQALRLVEHPILFNNLGVVLKAAGQAAEAEAAYRRAIALQPDYVDAHNNLGALLQEQQRLPEAEAAYNNALSLQPGNAGIQFNLALLYHSVQRPTEAEAAYRRTLAIAPEFVQAYYSLGVLLQEQDRPSEAEAVYRQTIALQPAHAEAHNNLGNILKQHQRLAEAEAAYRQAIAHQPGYTSAHYNLGILLQDLHRYEEAETAYRQAISIQPDYFEALNNLGNLLKEQGQVQAAEAALRQAVSLLPDNADAHYNLGRLLLLQKRFDEAEHTLRQALALQPDFPETLNNLGLLLEELKRFSEAEASYRQAIVVQPGYAESYNHLGNLLLEQKRFSEAESAYRQAIVRSPELAEAHYNLGNLLMEQKRLLEAEAPLRQAVKLNPTLGKALGQLAGLKRSLCDWAGLGKLDRALAGLVAKGEPTDTQPFILLTLPSSGATEQKQAGRLYAEHKYGIELASPPLVPSGTWRQRERLRIGYLSADFHEHATMHLLAGVLEHHDLQRFDIRLYSYGPTTEDSARRRLLASGLPFHELGQLSDQDAARRIAADEVDILLDLKGHTQHNRLGISALRPAPVIVSWLGYPATLGHPRLADYLIGDAIVTPPEHAEHFSETLALMPHCYQPNDCRRVIGARPTRAQASLPEQGFVFASFNQCYKLNAETLTLWCRLLQAVPGSVLWLLKPHEAAIANLRREAAQRGIDPERLVFAPSLPHIEHLGRLQLADLALDTFPVTSHTTASDALWAGVPLVTKIGESFASRVAASLLNAVGLPELITTTDEAYCALAYELACQPEKLAALRSRLAEQKTSSPLFDTAGFTRDLETLYLRIWHS